MTNFLMMTVLLIAVSAYGGSDGDVTVRLNDVSPMGARTNTFFQCSITVHNAMSTSFTAANLFYGLVMRISDSDGKELKRVHYTPHIVEPTHWVILPGDNTYTNILYGLGWRDQLSLPGGVHAIKVQVQGALFSGSYTNHLASNVVALYLP